MKRWIILLCLCILTACSSSTDASVSNADICIEETYQSKYIIQGTCRVDDYILVSAYNPGCEYYSVIFMYDLDGNFIKLVNLKSYSHVGAISYHDGLLYVSGIGLQYGDVGYVDNFHNANEALTDVYNIEDIINNDGSLVNKVDTIYYADDRTLLFSSASLRGNSLFSTLNITTYNHELCLFTCNYNRKYNTHLVIIPISSIQDDGLVSNKQIISYAVPLNRIQGVLYIGNNEVLLVQSNGDSESKLYKCKIQNERLVVEGHYDLPAHGEEVSFYDENTIMVSFEQYENVVRYYNLDSIEFKKI